MHSLDTARLCYAGWQHLQPQKAQRTIAAIKHNGVSRVYMLTEEKPRCQLPQSGMALDSVLTQVACGM